MTRWAEWEVRLERAGEWLNPILVKEARQSLKSNHFSYSFMLLLLAAVVWSFLGLFYWSSSGSLASSSTMLSGYFFMLLFPLFLIVPFAAYRSLAAEREDGTFELMSITN
ncbi:MAG: ABC transporter permease, partial [Planctomycetota bacterium]